ncbi:MAG: site-2 protease family protein [Phycisphaerae bacterium]|nr:site-2 protease family protein [Phycisphaerae bacterium]
MFNITDLMTRIPIVLLALTVHEFSHAYVAYRLGDPTAQRMGRCTLNPLAHLDLFGTLCIMFGPIGWAKPVPVNPFNFRHPGRDNMLVSIAGPISNLLQAMAFALLLRGILHSNILDVIPDARSQWNIFRMVYIGVLVNCGLAVFNMLPIFPLDGFHVTRYFLGPEGKRTLDDLAPYGMYIILGLVALPFLTGNSISPLLWLIRHPVNLVLTHVAGCPGAF